MEEIDLQAIATALLDGQGLPGKPRSAYEEEADQEPDGDPYFSQWHCLNELQDCHNGQQQGCGPHEVGNTGHTSRDECSTGEHCA